MTNKFYFFRSFAPENGSGMDRLCIGTTTMKSRKLLSLLFVLILGVGQMWGAEGTTHNISVDSYYTTGVLLNNAASINAMTINNLSYPVKKVAVTCNYNKTTDGVTVSCTVNGTAFGSPQTIKTSTTTTFNFEGSSTSGDVVISFVNNTNASSKMGTFKVTAVVLTEGAAAGPTKTLSSIAVQTAPTKKKYLEGETFDPTGLVITRTYSDATSDTYAYAGHTSDFTFSPTTSTALSTSNTSVSITYGGKSTSQAINVYNVTMQARDEDGNTIPSGGPEAPSRTGNSISPAADANNYVFKEWQKTNADLGSSATTKANTITNPTGAVTVTAIYYKPITITYKANGSTFHTQTYAYGGTLAFPTSNPDGATYSCSGKTFTGWVAEANKDYSHASTAPTYATAGSSVTTEATYYAVFAEASGSGDEEWVATDLGDLTSSDVFVIADDTYAIPNDNGTTSAPEVTSITVVSDAITSEVTDNLKWNISGNSTDGYTFYPNGSTTTWLYCNTTASSKSNDNIRVGTGDRKVWLPNNSGYLVTNDSYTDRYLSRYNTQDFRGYTGTGNGAFEPVFYKLTSSVTYSNYETNCCTPLSSINGSVSLTQTTAALEWADLEHVSSWAVKYKEHSAQNWSDWNGAQATANSKRSVTITNLSCGTAYDFKIAASAASGYCDAEDVLEDKSTTKWNITYTLTNTVSLSEGPAQGANACGEITATFSKNASYTFPETITVTVGDNTLTAENDYLWDNSEGTLVIGADKVTGNVVIAIAGVAPANPIVTPDPTSLSFTQVKKGAAVPAAKDIAITGQNLTSALTVTSSNTDLYVVSVKSGSLTPDANKDASPVITVTPQEGITSTAGDKDATITISGGGLANSVVINVTFNVQETYTVNWYVNGTKIDANSKTDVTGTAVTAPSDFSSFTDCVSDFHFIGWAESAIAGGSSTSKPTLVTPITTIGTANKDYYAVFADGTPGSQNVLLSEEFDNTTTSDASSEFTTSKFPNFNGSLSKAYTSQYGGVKFGTSSVAGYITSKSLDLSKAFSVSIKAKRYNDTDGGNIEITIDGDSDTKQVISNNDINSSTFENFKLDFDAATSTSTIKIGTSTKRAYIDDVVVSQESDPVWTKYYSTCPHITSVTLSAGSAEHGSISFEKGGSAVTSVRTDGESPVEVDVVKDINDGYELTGLTLTSEDVTGATKNDALTKITIPAGAEGTLTVTPTITIIPKYSITFANGGADGGSAPTAIVDQYAGTEITLPENTYTYTGHKFDKWKVTYGETELDKAVGETFEMPAANVTITATWNKIEKCAMSFMVAGNEVASANVQQEEAYSLASVSHPNVPGFTWEGWSETERDNEVTTQPTTITSYTPEAGEGKKTLYGIYKRVDTSGANYGKYVRATSVAEGDYLIVCESESKVFDGSLTTLEASDNNKAATISAGVLTLENADSYVFTIATKQEGYSIKSASNNYIGHSGSSNALKESTTDSYTNTITISEGNATISCGSYSLKYNKASNQQRFRYFSSGQESIQLYKKDNGTTYYTSSPVEKVTITFNANGGEGGCSQRVINKGSQLTICSDVPTKSHSDFTGWNSKQNGSGDVYAAGQTYTFNETVTLYAQWAEAATYDVTFDKNGGTGTAVTIEDQYAGDQITLPAALTKDGYTFQGWKYDGMLYAASAQFTMPASEVEFVAQFRKESIPIDKMSLITDANALSDGMQVVIAQSVASDAQACKVMGAQNGNNRSAVECDITNNVLSITNQVSQFTLVALGDNTYAFKTSENKYLYAASSNSNYLKDQETLDDNGKWTITIVGGVATIKAQGANTRNWMRYNSSSSLFSCYASGQGDICLFGKAVVVSANVSGEDTKISDLGFVEGETVVASGTGVVLTIDEPTPTTSITASNGATVVVNTADAQAENITVEDGGTVEVAQDVTVETLVISTSLGSISGEEGNTGGKSGQVTGSGSINATGDVFIQIELTQDKKASAGWYAFSLPFKVDALNGVYFGDKKLQNEKDYAIMAWHGEIRATGEYGWKKYREVMDPGVLYIITVGNTDYKTLRFKKVAGEAIVQAENYLTISEFATSDENRKAKDAGWNGIGNKSLQIMQQGSYSTMQFLDHTDNAFKARNNGDVNILVGSAFFVQYGSTVGTTVSMEASTSGSIALAPAREQESIEKVVFEAKLKNAETGKTEDNLFFTAREDALNEYEAGRDVTKMSMGEAKCAQMFIPAYGTKLCAADFPLVNNQATYPLTLTIPTTGTYSISIKENENANIYLTKNGAIIWNLTQNPYTVEMEHGATEGYGLMLVKRMPQDVETVSGDASEAGVQKVVINDKVFILRGEKLYDLTGKAVR